MDNETKDGFTGEFSFLSNMYETPCKYKGVVFPSSEHLYQWLKVKPGWWADKIKEAPHGKVAKKLANNPKCPKVETEDWKEYKLWAMAVALDSKFKNEEMKNLLLQTNDVKLVEYNHWKDTFWGVCNDAGENNLGIMLMEFRELLKNDCSPNSTEQKQNLRN